MAQVMLLDDEWDKKPDIKSVLKPMIMEYLEGKRDAYTAEEIVDNMGLLEHNLFYDVDPIDVLKGVNDTLDNLERDGQIQSKRVRMGNSIKWHYRPVPKL